VIVWWSRIPPYEAGLDCWIAATVEDVERLIHALRSRDRRARAAAARVLERLRGPEPPTADLRRAVTAMAPARDGTRVTGAAVEAAMPLIGALYSPDSEIRELAAARLGELGDVRAVMPLMQVLDDDLWFVRQSAATALGRLGDLRAVDALRSHALAESVPSTREACWHAVFTLLGEDPATAHELVPAPAPRGRGDEAIPAAPGSRKARR
jgi:HEAT repeat protein